MLMAVVAMKARAKTCVAVHHEGGEPGAHDVSPCMIGGRARVKLSWAEHVLCAAQWIAMHH